MPRTADIPGVPATKVLQVRLTPADLEALDAQRSERTRSEYVRDLLRQNLPQQAPDLSLGKSAGRTRPENDEVGTHRHRRGKQISEMTLKGVTTKTYRCSEPGCNQELTK